MEVLQNGSHVCIGALFKFAVRFRKPDFGEGNWIRNFKKVLESPGAGSLS